MKGNSMVKPVILISVVAALGIIACGDDGGPQAVQKKIDVVGAFPQLSFERPVDLQNAGDGSNRLFVVEQAGRILVFENDPAATEAAVFLDIRDRVSDAGNEEGLLGLAFPPQYENSGHFYVYYSVSDPRRTRLSRFSVTALDPNAADPASETILLEADQPYANHKGGQIAFGPDAYLYIALGDGGSGGDPQGNGQNRATLLGKILRIDVGRTPYGIPPDNPFAGNTSGYREEIYAYGLRNPWRFSFDPVTGWLWAADVGQNDYEEIDTIEKGKNYGWNIMEGMHCYDADVCQTGGLALPVWEYSHKEGQSVTGGFVYRGAKLPELSGKYVYADFVSGKIWALRYDGLGPPANELLIDTGLNISSLGVDEGNEIYICAFDDRIHALSQVKTSR